MGCLWQGVEAMFRGLAFPFIRFRVCGGFVFQFRFCVCGGFVYFICAFGVGFGRLAVAVVLCACLAGSVCHTATALFLEYILSDYENIKKIAQMTACAYRV